MAETLKTILAASIEAGICVVNEQGTVVLVADTSANNLSELSQNSPKCPSD